MQLNSINNYQGKQNRSTKRRDDEVDKVRTIFWFEYLAIQIGSRRPRDIQRAISPMMKVDALGGVIKNNKFLGYSRGEHVPRNTIVKKAEALYSHSAVVLNHVLWEVLKAGTLNEERARQLVGQLDPDIQKAVVKSGNHFSDNNRASEMLERRPCLDSLTALTILFRMNHGNRSTNYENSSTKPDRAWLYACSIFRLLVVMERQFLTDNVRNYIFQLFVDRVFNQVTSFWGARMNLENYNYLEMSLHLRQTAKNENVSIRYAISRDDRAILVSLIYIPLNIIKPANIGWSEAPCE